MQTDAAVIGIGGAKDAQTNGATAEETVVIASVTLKADWIDYLRNHNERSAEEILTEIAEEQRCHKVKAIPDPDGERWRLEGCICGIKAAREELIRRRKDLETDSRPSISSSTNVQETRECPETHLEKHQNITRRERNEDAKTKEDEVAMKGQSLYPNLSNIQQFQTETTQQQQHENRRLADDHYGGRMHSISGAPIASIASTDDQRRRSEEDRQRKVALKLARNVEIDRHVFDFLCLKEIDELNRISRRCSLFESNEDGRTGSHQVALQANPGEDLETIVANFKDLCSHVTDEVVELPEKVFVGDFEKNAKAKLDMKKVYLQFVKDTNICQIFGRKKEVAEARRILEDLIRANKAERFQTNRATHVNHGGNDYYYPPPSPSYPSTGSSYASSAPYNRTSRFTVCQDRQNFMQVSFNSKDPLVLEMIGRDMFEINDYSDVTVTLIDHYLNPFGILAKQIASKYRPGITNELQQIKSQYPFLQTGALVHTGAYGFLAAKVLMHLVPPTAVEFPPNDHRSMFTLRNAFLNCFNCANDVLKMNSLCLPAVGCNIYPVSMVADCFMDAVEEFHRSINTVGSTLPIRPNNLRRIRIVNNDRSKMTEFIRWIKTHRL